MKLMVKLFAIQYFQGSHGKHLKCLQFETDLSPPHLCLLRFDCKTPINIGKTFCVIQFGLTHYFTSRDGHESKTYKDTMEKETWNNLWRVRSRRD